MATRAAFENSADIGVFACLTNKYCLCAQAPSANFFRCARRPPPAPPPVPSVPLPSCGPGGWSLSGVGEEGGEVPGRVLGRAAGSRDAHGGRD